eukprot:06856.XXX_372136_372372_1 [CDS] Oithona nana genome sequencing.
MDGFQGVLDHMHWEFSFSCFLALKRMNHFTITRYFSSNITRTSKSGESKGISVSIDIDFQVFTRQVNFIEEFFERFSL